MTNNINSFIEHTNLRPTVTDKDIDLLVKEAKEFEFSGVCVPPFWVKRAKREIGSSPINLVTVIGFPFGYQMTEIRTEEIRKAIETGADELDVVMNISAFKMKMDWFKIDLTKCSKLIHEQLKIFKVIIETSYLDNDEIIRACKICSDVGADYVKTSTGFSAGGATTEHVRLIRNNLPSEVGIKASGGIKTYEQVLQLIEAGADRIGTSSGVEIMRQQYEKSGYPGNR